MDRLSDRALGRALLARQGLLEPFDEPLVEVVEAIGAMQGQRWAALPAALAARMRRFAPDDLYGALERRELVWGILLRGTLHLVSAREHPAYAVAAASTDGWRRSGGDTTPAMRELRAAMLAFAEPEPRTNADIVAFVEDWVAANPSAIDVAEIDAQRALRWRPIYRWSSLVRAPADGRWGAKAPADHRAAPCPPSAAGAPDAERALDDVIRRHLRAFGPATADDIACWIGWRTSPVRAALTRLEPELELLEGDSGRALYDLHGAPRPDPDIEAPPRFLAAFDSALLAYDPGARSRILPEELRDLVYERRNLQVRPSFIVDGLVAGTWSVEVRRRIATLTLQPGVRLTKRARAGLSDEGERLLRAIHPAAREQRVAFE